MSTHKTFFGKLFGWIGDIFHNAAEKLWNELTPEEQASLKHGSGVIAIINQHLNGVPKDVVSAIETEFPDLDIPKLEAALLQVCATLNIAPHITVDINGAIVAIQTWLQTKEDNTVWKWASQTAAELISVFLNPTTTFFEKVSVLMQWVYDTFIKKP